MNDATSRGSPRRRSLSSGLAGLVLGGLLGVALLVTGGVAVAHRLAWTGDRDPGALIEAAHVPPLLTAAGDSAQLRYDIYCAAPGADPESGAPCDAGGTVYVRSGGSGAFRALPLRLDAHAPEGRYVADVSPEIATSRTGFSYYAVVRNNASGAETTIPAGGAAAPQRSMPLGQPVSVSLGTHVFGRVHVSDARVASASWGDGEASVGLEGGPQETPIGASSFDVDTTGTVTVLDEAHRRLLRFTHGGGSPVAVPVAVHGTIADLAVASDGTSYVLETAGQPAGETPLVRSFAPDGSPKGAWHTAEPTVSALRMGPNGPVALGYPASQWMPVALGGTTLDRQGQLQRASAGRPLPGGGDMVVLRDGNEVRVAEVGRSGVQRSWRISSQTPVAEVQLAQPIGNLLALVLRVYTDTRDEFVVLLLDGHGIARQFSIDSADWAETAPLSRFRFVGTSLYQLGSTPAGMFVDRFDLGVSQ
jgi:hypothetical protein